MHGCSDSKGQTASCSDDSQAHVARAWAGSIGHITYLLRRLADRESSIECAGFIRKLVCKEDRSSSKVWLELLSFTFFFQTGFTGHLSFCWFETTNKKNKNLTKWLPSSHGNLIIFFSDMLLSLSNFKVIISKWLSFFFSWKNQLENKKAKIQLNKQTTNN